MEIKNIEIKNFKGISASTLSPSKISVFTGENGHGKTTMLSAIQYLTYGIDAETPIKAGETEMSVEGYVNGVKVTRGQKIGANGEKKTIFKLNGKNTTIKSYNEFLTQTGAEFGDIVGLMATANLSDVDNLTELLLKYGQTNLSRNRLCQLIQPLTVKMEEEIEKYFSEDGISLEDIANFYEYLKGTRAMVKKNLEQKKAQAVWLGTVPDLKVSETDILSEIEQNIGVIAAKKQKDENYRNYLQAVENRKRAEEQVAIAKANVETYRCNEPKAEEIANFNMQLESGQKDIINLQSLSRTLENNIKMFEKTLQELDTARCPLSNNLVCKTDKTAVRQELSDSISSNKRELKNIAGKIEEINTRIDGIKSRKEVLERDKNKYGMFLNALNTLNALEKAMPKEPNKVEQDTTDITMVIRKNEVLQAKLDNLKKYTEYQEKVKAVAVLQEQRDMYEKLCKLFDTKGGIREKVLSSTMESLEEYINERATALGIGFSVNIRTNKGVRVYYNPKGGMDFIPYENASAGEQLLITFLVLDMLNALSGAGIMFLDNLDKLDKENARKFVNLLKLPEVQDAYDHLFIACVNHEEIIEEFKQLHNCDIITL